MKLKLNKDGSAVVKDGKPVYVHSNGREEAFDAPAAWRLALGEHFKNSPVMEGIKLPSDMAASFFGDSFRLEAGKLVAVDKHGIQLYSPTRHGEPADFNEAFAQLVDGYEKKGMIQREPGAPAPAAAAGQQRGTGSTITRTQFDSLPPASRAKFMSEGGRIGDVASAGTPAPAPSPAPRAGSITRAQFDGLTPIARAAHFKSGGTMTD
ncbi:DUF6651 domain-containing protein [Burkholderia sp. LMU1-1-1.1]|uniref:DUF6651 domain-containing protein n=1 Tax=Burkholderia sp. LMU1-1-1.1 TaxID=3135266 RepID=UPI00342D7CEE